MLTFTPITIRIFWCFVDELNALNREMGVYVTHVKGDYYYFKRFSITCVTYDVSGCNDIKIAKINIKLRLWLGKKRKNMLC